MPTAVGLYYFESGEDVVMRPPVILIHGAGGDHLYWPPQIRRLPDQRVLALDLRGHGKSPGIGHHTIDDYARDVIEFASALKVNQMVIVGHSMGSAIALQAAILFPKRILGLGLVGGGARLRVASAILQSASNPSAFSGAVHLITDLSFASRSGSHLRELAERRMAEMRPSVLYGDFLACDAFDAGEQLSNITAPTLILCGAEDRMTPPRNSRFLHEHIAGAKLELVPGAGHMVMLEQPERVAKHLERFLASIPYQSGR
jgi:pimeloyl-ACP methyl ester carboxylesterase